MTNLQSSVAPSAVARQSVVLQMWTPIIVDQEISSCWPFGVRVWHSVVSRRILLSINSVVIIQIWIGAVGLQLVFAISQTSFRVLGQTPPVFVASYLVDLDGLRACSS